MSECVSSRKLPIFISKTESKRSNRSKRSRRRFDKHLETNPAMKIVLKRFLEENEQLRRTKLQEISQSSNNNPSGINNGAVLNYEKLSKKYLEECLNSRIVAMISRIANSINEQFNMLNDPLHLTKSIIRLCKCLLINEIELIVFSIYLERLGKSFDIEFETYITILGLLTKLNTSINCYDVTTAIFNERRGLQESFESFVKIHLDKDKINLLNVSIQEVNTKFEFYSRSSNISCKDDFVDYNFCVDQILAMSLPYSEVKKQKEIMKSSMVNSFKSNLKPNIEEIKQLVVNEEQIKTIINQYEDVQNNIYLNIVGNNPFLLQQVQSNNTKNAEDISYKPDLVFNSSIYSVANMSNHSFEPKQSFMSTINNERKVEIPVYNNQSSFSTYNLQSISKLNSNNIESPLLAAKTDFIISEDGFPFKNNPSGLTVNSSKYI